MCCMMRVHHTGDQTETKLRFELSLIEKLLVLDRDEVLDPNKDSFDFLIGYDVHMSICV